jgi:3-hydroxyisobutyrate dehydrogenase-like beta-hydroxyacid dehydrogenase
MSEVSVIGLGAMGSAIASALLEAGRSIIVWNRSREKAEPLAARGAEIAADAMSAVAGSPASIVCVDNYAVSMAILGDARAALEGKTLVQLTSDTGTAAEELAEWSTASDARYLDGVILAYPSDMGSPEARIVLAGDLDAWATVEPLMRDLAGASTYVGENVRVPSMLSAAVIAPLLGLVVGAAQGAAMCEAERFPVADYAAMMSSLSGLLNDQMQHTLATIAEDRFDNPEAALKTYASSVSDRTAESRLRGVNVEFYGFVDGLLTRSIDQGLGDQELSAIIKLWR